MKTIGVRELKDSLGSVLADVRQKSEEIEITYHGEVIAKIVPVAKPKPIHRKKALGAIWASMDELAKQISTAWPANVSAVESIQDIRREL